jgi:mRNA interferase MazF
MKEGNVILTQVPQADGKLKERPAIFLREMPPYRDLLVCGVSTQLHHYVKKFDELISPADVDFGSSCIRTTSMIRLGFLAVLPRHRVLGSVGFTSAERHKRLLRKLSDYLTNSTQATDRAANDPLQRTRKKAARS